jgi:hypothetical protein
MAAQTFIRWEWLGLWERLLTMAQAQGVKLGMILRAVPMVLLTQGQ